MAAYLLCELDINACEAIEAEARARVAAHCRERVIQLLAEAMDRELRHGAPARPPSGEQEALAMIRTVAQDIKAAADALDVAAEALREAESRGQTNTGKAANAAKRAAARAHLAHTGLVGE